MRWVRLSVALTLTVAVGSLPLVLDQCSAICAVSRAATARAKASATSADPTCGPAQTRGTHVDGMADACGHDHTGVDRATVGDSPEARPLTVPLVALVTASAVIAPARTFQARDDHSMPPLRATAHVLGSPLRI